MELHRSQESGRRAGWVAREWPSGSTAWERLLQGAALGGTREALGCAEETDKALCRVVAFLLDRGLASFLVKMANVANPANVANAVFRQEQPQFRGKCGKV